MPLDQIDDYALWIAAVVSGLVALGWLARKVWRAIRWANDLGETIERLHALADHELTPNSGSSMKDALTRIEGNAKRTEGRLTEHLAQSSQVVLQMQRAHLDLARRVEAAEKRDHELVDALHSLASTMPIVARSTPPDPEEQ